MAKRRRLTAPDSAKLQDLEKGFAAKPAPETKSMAPIAQVAGEAAAMAAVADTEDRRDAAILRGARVKGLLAEDLLIDAIDANYITRDRVIQTADAAEELRQSMAQHGQRTPIEVVRTDDGYGLISGWRRLQALKAIGADQVKAFVRTGRDANATYLDMIEENEVRANLTHYERGRIASVAAGQGVFADVEAAVNYLFASASKAKRSKVRSFATIHEALGDLLKFPTALTEKSGLKVAQGLAGGQIKPLRASLADLDVQSPAQELAALMAVLTPAAKPTPLTTLPTVPLKKGGKLTAVISGQGLKIDVQGRAVNPDTAKRILRQIEKLLD